MVCWSFGQKCTQKWVEKVCILEKPHNAIYDLARMRLAELGTPIDNKKILAIGDGIGTDIKGANSQEIDSLFVTGGLAAKRNPNILQPKPRSAGKVYQKAKSAVHL